MSSEGLDVSVLFSDMEKADFIGFVEGDYCIVREDKTGKSLRIKLEA